MFSANNIYTKIDKLDEVKTVKELLVTLKPILNELAYYAVTGDGAVMEMHETWHNTFTDYIYEATPGAHPRPSGGQQRPNQLRVQPNSNQPQTNQQFNQPQTNQQFNQPQTNQQQLTRPQTNQQFNQPQTNQQQLTRPDPRDMPFSLKTIMNGTHSSFNEN